MDDYSFDTQNKSERLRDIVRQGITEGHWKPGDRLPSESELATQYKVSRSTVREAITSLSQEGLLIRIHGKGSFVAEAKPVYCTFAVVMPFLFFSDSVDSQPFGAGTDVQPRLMQSIEGASRRSKANILLYLNNRLPQLERENITNIIDRQADGVLLNYTGGVTNRDALEMLRASGIPLVLIDSYIDDLPIDTVVTDNVLGAYQATRLMVAQGFSRVFHITISENHSSVRDRRLGYENAMREMDCAPEVFSIENNQIDETGADQVSEEERAYRLAQSILKTHAAPVAVFATDAPILAGFWRAIQEYGLPHDHMALACFDEHFINFPANIFSIKVIQPFAEIGRRSVAILQERVAKRGPAEPYRVFLEPEIVARKV